MGGILRLAACLALTCLVVTGCMSVASEGVNIAKDKAIVANNMAEAQAGNALAQFKVGDARCCSVHEGTGFYNTPQSVEWLCRAAAQNHGPAQEMLGEIYSGDVISGVRLARRVAQRVAGTSTDLAVAYSWFDRAAVAGQPDALTLANRVWQDVEPQDRQRTEDYVKGKTPLPCLWHEVFKT